MRSANLYAALDVASGKVISQMTARHRAVGLKRFLDRVDKQVLAELAVHVSCDNSSTHKTPAIQRWLLAHPRVHLHFTPTYSSWLHLVERWFAELTTKWLRRGTHRSVREPEQASQAWIEAWNKNLGRWCGPRPPTRSSTPSPPTASESTTQDTSPAGTGQCLFSLLTLVDPSMQCGSDLGRYGRWNDCETALGSVMIRAVIGGGGRDSWND
jgi:transposase